MELQAFLTQKLNETRPLKELKKLNKYKLKKIKKCKSKNQILDEKRENFIRAAIAFKKGLTRSYVAKLYGIKLSSLNTDMWRIDHQKNSRYPEKKGRKSKIKLEYIHFVAKYLDKPKPKYLDKPKPLELSTALNIKKLLLRNFGA